MAYEMKIRGTEDEVKVRSPWAAALLPIVTLGIYHLVWWYRINRELRDYGNAKGYDLGQNPTNSVLALFPGGIIIVPALVTYWRGIKRVMGASTPGRQGAAQRLDRDHPLPAALARALGLHPGLAQRRLAAGSRSAAGPGGAAGSGDRDAAAAATRAAAPASRLRRSSRLPRPAEQTPASPTLAGHGSRPAARDPRRRRRAVLPRRPGLGVGGARGALLRGDDQPAGGAARSGWRRRCRSRPSSCGPRRSPTTARSRRSSTPPTGGRSRRC